MVLKIRKYGEKVLREKAQAVAVIDDRERVFAQDMLETMRKARGVGLAAPQVGVSRRLCVIDVPPECDNEFDAMFNAPIQMPLVMWNPEILQLDGSVCDKEGCLSFPDIGGSIVRAEQVVCRYTDADNRQQTITVRGYLARAVQHELDHLDGILYVDHMSAVDRLARAAKLRKLAKANGDNR